MFAGSDGSGKTTIKSIIRPESKIPTFSATSEENSQAE